MCPSSFPPIVKQAIPLDFMNIFGDCRRQSLRLRLQGVLPSAGEWASVHGLDFTPIASLTGSGNVVQSQDGYRFTSKDRAVGDPRHRRSPKTSEGANALPPAANKRGTVVQQANVVEGPHQGTDLYPLFGKGLSRKTGTTEGLKVQGQFDARYGKGRRLDPTQTL